MQGRRDHNLVAMLSLYLLVLAFFILLNALSKLEEDRTRTVLESVNAAFDGRIESVKSVKSHPAALDSLQDGSGLLTELQALFRATIPATVAEVAADGPVMRVTFAADGLFRPESSELLPGRALLLRRVAGVLLDEQKNGLLFDLEVLHGVPEDGGRTVAEAGARSLEVRRMGVLGRDFQERGLPPEQLSIGIAPGYPGVVHLIVRLRERPSDPVDLGQAEE